MRAEDRILSDADYMTRREKWADFLNDPRLFFKRLRYGYYDERVMYNTRWILAKDAEEAERLGMTLAEYETDGDSAADLDWISEDGREN